MDHHYDIAIVGMGCAGSHLVLELLRQQTGKKVIIIDDYSKKKQTKTWSFWEQSQGSWDHLIYKNWTKAWFKTKDETIELNVSPYVYKSIESHAFTAFAKAESENNSLFTFKDTLVNSIRLDPKTRLNHITYNDASEQCTADLVLDSRIDTAFFEDRKAVTLQQHFKGWIIETQTDCFDPEWFTMMDYSIIDPGTTSFTYVLPFSKRRALVEFTYFSKEIVDDATYDRFLKQYISEQLNIDDYKILEVERGIIPMTTYNFTQHNRDSHIKVGTAGGWVKPSTGYSFKSSETKARLLVDNYLKGKPITQGMFPKKAEIYDATLLEVLYNRNDRGDQVFYTLYKKNNLPDLLSFLDEKTSIADDIRIMTPMTSVAFVSAFFKQLF
jgi:lycopene beta-cyclase